MTLVSRVRQALAGLSIPQFGGFVLAAGCSLPFNIGARVLLSRVTSYEIAIVGAHLVGMTVAFTLSRIFVFAPSGRGIGDDLWRFSMINVLSLAQTWLVSVGLVRLVFPAIGFHYAPDLVGHVIGLATTAVTSFLGHGMFSFGKR